MKHDETKQNYIVKLDNAKTTMISHLFQMLAVMMTLV